MCTSKPLPVLAITNRHLSKREFLAQIAVIAKKNPKAIVLREKDLSNAEYHSLAHAVLTTCEGTGVPVILHSFVDVALALGQSAIHLPLPVVLGMSDEQRAAFRTIGVSIHSVEEAKQAQAKGATYLTAGHIFATGCKPGVPPRGLSFLSQVVEAVEIPVYAIGGIDHTTLPQVMAAGAAGGCMMSGMMKL